MNAPGLQPFFLIGDDYLSRQWLANRREILQRLGAAGLAVNVASADRLAAIRRWTPGLAISSVIGDDLAARLGIAHHPILITPTALEQYEIPVPSFQTPHSAADDASTPDAHHINPSQQECHGYPVTFGPTQSGASSYLTIKKHAPPWLVTSRSS